MKSLFAIVCFVLLGLTVSAQVVNVEKTRSQDSTKKFQGFVYLGANFTWNTKNVFQGYDKVQIQYQPNKNNMFLLLNEITMMKVDSVSYLDDGFVHLRYNRKFQSKPWVILEAFTQFQYDKALNVDSRYLAGIGPRWAMFDSDSLDLFLGTLTMYEREQRTDEDLTEKHRFAGYLSANWTFGKKKSISSIIYYQPRYSDMSDYRVSGEVALKLGLGKLFFYQVSYSVKYDENPPNGVHTFNSSMKNKIGIKF